MSAARDYLAAHGVQEALAAAVSEVLRSRPADPILGICDILTAKEAAKASMSAASGAKFDSAGALLAVGELPPLRKLGEGKVRDLYEVDAGHLLVVVTDRISAFDVIMLNGVKGKGKVLNQLTAFWLRHLAENGLGIEHHMVTDDVAQMPESCKRHASILEGRSMLVRKLRMLPVESIVRGYITGSGWADYQKTGSVCGHVLPAGLQLCAKLPEELFTPSTKAELGQHDENITVSEASAMLGESIADDVSKYARRVYTIAAAHAAPRGVLVADTKMEFGVALDATGGAPLILGDEVLTPDCSRYWPSEGYEAGKDQPSYDKQYVRDYLSSIKFDKKTPIALPAEVVGATIEKYIAIYKLLTDKEPVL